MSAAATSRVADLRASGFRGEIDAERPLGPLTTWRIGGPAELLAQPTDLVDLQRAVAWAEATDLPWRVLGNGSNLLVADAGVRGLVLRVRRVLDRVESTEREAHAGPARRLVVGAGASFPALARRAAAAGLAGIEFGTGIPGTMGGAVVMNAGWHEYEVGNVIESVRVLQPDGSIETVGHADCAFGYRTSRFRHAAAVVVGATLRLEPGPADEIEARLEHFAVSRKANQPTELASCGSVFLKPEGDFAGRLIDAAGLKGHRVGGLEVSPKHANFFVNTGGGSADDALELIAFVEAAVQRRFGVKLVREFDSWE